MGTYAALSHTTWVDGYDMTGDLNETKLQIQYDPQVKTVFGNTAQNRAAGLETVDATVNGFADFATGAVDPTIMANLKNLKTVTQTVSGTAGDRAYIWQAKDLSYQLFDQVGAMAPFSLSLMSARGASQGLSVGAVRGNLLKAKGTISATGATGSTIQVGAVGATQFLYCAVHVFSIGTSFTLQIQSDDSSGMSSPTTRMTTPSITAVGGTWVTRVAGAITDDWWRVNVSAVSGTSTIAVAIGIK